RERLRQSGDPRGVRGLAHHLYPALLVRRLYLVGTEEAGMNAKSLGVIAAVVVLSTIAIHFGPPDPRASWVPGPLSQLVLALEDSFDRYDGIGVLCSDRTPRPVTV